MPLACNSHLLGMTCRVSNKSCHTSVLYICATIQPRSQTFRLSVLDNSNDKMLQGKFYGAMDLCIKIVHITIGIWPDPQQDHIRICLISQGTVEGSSKLLSGNEKQFDILVPLYASARSRHARSFLHHQVH